MKTPFRKLVPILAADKQGNAQLPTEIELLQTGDWNTPYHGHFEITKEDLDEYKAHAEDSTRKGLPIDLEHNSIGGAVGWLGESGFDVRENEQGGHSLWGSTTWTPKGAQLITDREYRFFSPEFADEDYEDPERAGQFMDNVLIGGGLTNRPLFKNLTAVAANDGTKKSVKGLTGNSGQNIIYLSEEHDNMNLQDILAKNTEDLTAEEKAFIVEHKDELTAEQNTSLTEAGVLEAENDDNQDDADNDDSNNDDDNSDDNADDNADDSDNDDAADNTPEAKAAREKGVTIKAGELAQLRRDAKAGRQAADTLSRKASEEHVASMLFNERTGGKLPVTARDDTVDFYHSLGSQQRQAFDKIIEKMPDLKLFSQFGDGGKSNIGTAAAEVKEKTEALIGDEKNKGLTYGGAVRKVLASDSDLKQRYNDERTNSKESK